MVGLSRSRGRGRGEVLQSHELSTSGSKSQMQAKHQTDMTSRSQLPSETSHGTQTTTQKTTTSNIQFPNRPQNPEVVDMVGLSRSRGHPSSLVPKQTVTGTPMATRSHALNQNPLIPQNLTKQTTRTHPLAKHQSQTHIPQLNSFRPIEEHGSNNSPPLYEFQQYGSDRLGDDSYDVDVDRVQEESLNDEIDRIVDQSLHNVDTPGQPSSDRSNRTRGPTRCLKLVTSSTKKVVYMSGGKAVGGVNGSEQHFVSETCVLAKQSSNLPLQVVDFKDIPKETLIRFWNLVQESYELHPNDDLQRNLFFKWIGERYRCRRAKLKQKYLKYNTDAERKRNPPPGVISADWDYLVSLFGSEEKKAQAQRNLINIGKSQSYHSVGSVSFERLRHREKEENGVEPNPLVFFKKTHVKKDGTPVNEDAAQKMKRMDELTQQVSQGLCSYTPNQIFCLSTGTNSSGQRKSDGATRRTKADLVRELNELEEQRVRKEEEQRILHEQEMLERSNELNKISNNIQVQMRLEMQEQMRVFMEQMRANQFHQQTTTASEEDDDNGEKENENANDGTSFG